MDLGLEELVNLQMPSRLRSDRRQFIGGSDARIIMSPDEAALIRLWKEKRGEAEPEDLSDYLVVQLGDYVWSRSVTWQMAYRAAGAPPPFSSMNSTPLASKTSLHHFERCATRLMRTCAELAQSASSCWLQSRRPGERDLGRDSQLDSPDFVASGLDKRTAFCGRNSMPAFRKTLSISAKESWFPA